MLETALIVEAPEAEALTGALRARLDASASRGVPAHVTILHPFLPGDAFTGVALAALADLANRTVPFAYRLTEVREFDAALWLRPEPDEPFRALTEAVWDRFPECPPYRGAHPRIVPHLTVAVRRNEPGEGARWHAARRTLGEGLPVACTASALSVFCADESGRWSRRTRLTFAP